MDTEINKYKIVGQITFWKFIENSKNYPGWNICTDDKGRNSLISLFEKMGKSEYPSKKEIKLNTPIELNQSWIKTNGTYKVANTVVFSNNKFSPDLWELQVDDSRLIINLGHNKLVELKTHLVNQAFDESISCGLNNYDNLLSFW